MWLSSLFRRFNNITVVISVLIQIINVLSEAEILINPGLTVSTPAYFLSDDDFDVTTIYNISNSFTKYNNTGGFKDEIFSSIYDGEYSVKIHSKTNSIDYLSDIITPSNSSIDNLFHNNTFIKFYPHRHWQYKYINTSGYYCDAENYTHFPDGNTTNCFEVFDYNGRYGMRNKKKKYILTIEWQPQNHLNSLRITYIFKRNIYFDIEIEIYDTNNNKLYSPLLKVDSITQLIIKSTQFDDDVKYKIVFSKKGNSHHINIDDMTPFSIFQIANYFQTSDSGYNSTITPGILPKITRPSPFNVFSSSKIAKKYETTHSTTDSSASNCSNGGYQLKDRCICPPGFRGVFCETGCGPNMFGADCSGLCSMFTENGCRGVYFCTSSYGCTCSAGLTGRFCHENCPPNTYGADCHQNCSSDCINKTCDQYTGLCTHGRLQGDKSTSCTEKHVAYLRHPPKLLTAEHDSITVEINFESENIICNDRCTTVKYYQLLWKDSNENTYHHTQIKPLNFNKCNETVNDLKPGTEYNIGVLIIMDDGNLNKEDDIVYGIYNTTCNENPSINEYSYQVIAGLRSIIITWDEEFISKQQCPIVELLLSLNIINHELQHLTQTLNIIPNSNHSYIIQDLVPGYEYSVNLTPKTTKGNLTLSHTYKVKPKFTDKDVLIKNITAKYVDQNKTIFISWKPVINDFGLNNDNFDKSLTYIIKYKINRILSCSIEEMKNDWISNTIKNSTDYEIQNVMPHSQYVIQVIMNSEDKNPIQRENIVYVLTPASLPTLKPIFEQTLNVTYTSATIKWKLDNSNCSSINGIYKGFFLVLKNINNNTENTIRTENNNITFNDLKPMNDYELKVSVENDIGHSLEHFLLIKFRSVESVSDLVIYKMNRKNHTWGLRWSYPTNKNLKQFVITIDNNKSNTVTIEPKSCLAWPSYYCHTISYLNQNYNFSVKVKAKVFEDLESGESSFTFYNNTDEIPDSPKNIIGTEIHETNVTIQWDIPWIFHGELIKFNIYIEEKRSLNNKTNFEYIKPSLVPFEKEQPTYNYTLINLKSGSTYSIKVQSYSTQHESSETEPIEITTLQ